MPMSVILTQDVANLGKAGELVNVKAGYGRNYLVLRGMAVSATAANVHRLEHDKKVIAKKVAKERAGADALAERINVVTLQFDRVVGDEDKMFGSVSTKDIVKQLGLRPAHPARAGGLQSGAAVLSALRRRLCDPAGLRPVGPDRHRARQPDQPRAGLPRPGRPAR